MYAGMPIVAAIKDLVLDSPVPVVFDHFGGAKSASGTEQPGFADLIELAGSGKAYVKISGAYRASMLAPDYSDVTPFARALVAANADRILWGTDWPHPDTTVRKGHTPMDTSPMLPVDNGPDGVNVFEAMRQAGHTKPETTMKYTLVQSERCEKAVLGLQRRWLPAPYAGIMRELENGGEV